MLGVEGPGDVDPPEGGLGVHAEVVVHLHDPLGPEGVLGVDDDDVGIQSSPVLGKGGVDCELEAHLGLAASELSEELGDGLTLDASPNQLVERIGTGGELGDRGTPLHDGVSGLESSDIRAQLGALDDVLCLLLPDLAGLCEVRGCGDRNRHDVRVSCFAELLRDCGSDSGYVFKGLLSHVFLSYVTDRNGSI